jgi:putative ABC transport system permease protein
MPVPVRRFWSKLRALIIRPSEADAMDEEIGEHLRLLQQRFEARGLPPEQARRAAHGAFGGVGQLRERLLDQQSFPWFDALCQDVRYAIRTIVRTPVVSLAVIVTFALGIGANAATFSLVNSLLLTPLSYRSPDRIVVVEPFYRNLALPSPGSLRTSSAPDFHDWRAQSHVFDAIAYHGGGEFRVIAEGEPTFGSVQLATPDFFRVFGIAPAAGRFWTEQENTASVAVVSHDWAVAHFGDPDKAIGRQFRTTRVLQIIGVAPAGFKYPRATDIWFPAGVVPENPNRGAHNYLVVGRLKPGVRLEEARTEMRAIGDRLEKQYPGNRNTTVALTPLREKLTGDARATLWLLFGTVAGVLLIACVNVANLQLVRAAARGREMAVRSAIGAGPGRVVRQVLTESLLLGGVGCLVGLAAGWLTLKAFVAIAPADIPRLNEVHIDLRVLLFTLGLTALCSLLFGLGPARSVARLDLSGALKQQSGRGVRGSVGSRARSLLVMAEVALSFALLVAAGLLLRSLMQLNRVDLGFSTGQVLAATTNMPAQGPEMQRQAVIFYRDLIERVRHFPGVHQAAGIRTMPFIGSSSDSGYTIDGNPTPPPGERPLAENQVITPGFFETVGIRITRGRDFSADDEFGRPQVAIVNERLVRDAFGGGNPIGRTIRTGMTREASEGMQIVGVVADTRNQAPETAAIPEIYLPYLQHPGPGSRLELLTHTSIAAEALAPSIREAAHALNPEVPIRFSTLDDALGTALAYPRFRAILVAGFAMLAVALALVGIYGVLSFLVSERTPEIGVRMAFGALRRDIFSHTIGTSMRLVAGGLIAGFVATLGVVRALQTVLYDVSPRDPLTIAAVAGLFAVTAFLASSIPALRASRVDPLVALRQD